MLSSRVYNFLIIIFIIASSLFLFFHQIQETNEYMGLKYFAIEPIYLFILIDCLVLSSLFIKIIKFLAYASIIIRNSIIQLAGAAYLVPLAFPQ